MTKLLSMDVTLALDEGTTSARTLAFAPNGMVLALAQEEFAQHFPQPGWVEHDADAIWAAQKRTLDDVVARVGAERISAIGITNQRETVVWDAATGKPLAPAIVWQCRRTSDHCQRLKAEGAEPWVRQRTGLVLDPYFSATKLTWLFENVSGLRAQAERGAAKVGTIDSWLLWNLTGGKVHATDGTNASRTLLMDLETRQWDDDLLQLFGVPRACLPEIRPSDALFGTTTLSGRHVPLRAILGDQQAALYGQGCHTPGSAKNTYGTGCFLLKNVGTSVPTPPTGLLATLAWERAGEDPVYALEGSVFVAGAAIQWLRDGLGILESAAQSEALARSVPDTGGVVFVPAFTGLGAPYWQPEARGLICGLTRGTTRAHLIRAALESMAHQSADLVETMEGIAVLRVDGGAARNEFLMQLQADYLGVPVERPTMTEITAFGAAKLAAETAGNPMTLGVDTRTRFTPQLSLAEREAACAVAGAPPWRDWAEGATQAPCRTGRLLRGALAHRNLRLGERLIEGGERAGIDHQAGA
jgi:glycerol kinase